MEAGGWERIYKEQGEVQFEVLPKVKQAANVFKEKSYSKDVWGYIYVKVQ